MPGETAPKETLIDNTPELVSRQIREWLSRIHADYRQANGLRYHVEDFCDLA